MVGKMKTHQFLLTTTWYNYIIQVSATSEVAVAIPILISPRSEMHVLPVKLQVHVVSGPTQLLKSHL